MATTTSFIPLTTTFTGPPECSSLFVMPGTGLDRGIYAFDPGYPLKDPTAPECAPDQALTWWQQELGITRYTDIGGPTFVCPQQFSTAAIIDQGTRTLVGCCPKSYTFIGWANPGTPHECSSALKPGVVTFISQGNDGVFSQTSSLFASTTAIFGVQINGYISPGMASSTGSSSTTSSTSSVSNASSTASTSTSTPTSESNTAPAANQPTGLSNQAKAGIGAGAAVVAVFILLGAIFWYRRRHRYSAVELAAGQDKTGSGGSGSETGYYAPPLVKHTAAQELSSAHGNSEYYAPTQGKPIKSQELSPASRPAELA